MIRLSEVRSLERVVSHSVLLELLLIRAAQQVNNALDRVQPTSILLLEVKDGESPRFGCL